MFPQKSHQDMYSLSDNNVYCIYEDHYGRIWVATFAGGINYITQNEAGKTLLSLKLYISSSR